MDVPILVVSPDPSIRALLEQMLAAEGLRSVVAWADERVEDAMRRLAPCRIVLDCDHELAGSEVFLERARGLGSTVVLFSPSRDDDDVRRCAAGRALAWFTFPIERRALARLLTSRDSVRRAASGGEAEAGD